MYPLGLLLYDSFRYHDIALQKNEFIGLGNYVSLLSDPDFGMVVLRTFLYTGVVVPISFLIGLGFALLVNAIRWNKVATILRIVLVLPMLFVPVSIAQLWRYNYSDYWGLVNLGVQALGGKSVPWLASPDTAIWAIMVTDIWAWSPYMFLILLAGLQALPTDPLEAAEIDGAGIFQRFRHVTLPLLRPVISIAILLKTLDTYRAFDYIWIMTKGGPGQASMTMTVYAYTAAFHEYEFGAASAVGVIAMIFPLVAIAVLMATGTLRRLVG